MNTTNQKNPTYKNERKVPKNKTASPSQTMFKNIYRGCLFGLSWEAIPKFSSAKRKHFCPSADVFFGSVKSVAVFLRLQELLVEFLVNIGKMKAATADFAGSTFLGSDFYRFYTIFNMNCKLV